MQISRQARTERQTISSWQHGTRLGTKGWQAHAEAQQDSDEEYGYHGRPDGYCRDFANGARSPATVVSTSCSYLASVEALFRRRLGFWRMRIRHSLWAVSEIRPTKANMNFTLNDKTDFGRARLYGRASLFERSPEQAGNIFTFTDSGLRFTQRIEIR